MWSAHCWWCFPRADGPELYKKAAEQVTKSKSVGSISLRLLFQFLPHGSYLEFISLLSSVMEYDLRVISWDKSFSLDMVLYHRNLRQMVYESHSSYFFLSSLWAMNLLVIGSSLVFFYQVWLTSCLSPIGELLFTIRIYVNLLHLAILIIAVVYSNQCWVQLWITLHLADCISSPITMKANPWIGGFWVWSSLNALNPMSKVYSVFSKRLFTSNFWEATRGNSNSLNCFKSLLYSSDPQLKWGLLALFFWSTILGSYISTFLLTLNST